MKIIMLVGPSGSGKTTVENLLEREGCLKVISHTSRDMRTGETEGIDYHFVNRDFFEENKDNFLEIVEFSGNLYGAFQYSLNDTLVNILVVEPNGQKQIQAYCRDNNIDCETYLLYISAEGQYNRMISRGDPVKLVEKRISSEKIAEEMTDLEGVTCTFDTEREEFSANIIADIITLKSNLKKSYMLSPNRLLRLGRVANRDLSMDTPIDTILAVVDNLIKEL